MLGESIQRGAIIWALSGVIKQLGGLEGAVGSTAWVTGAILIWGVGTMILWKERQR